MLLNHTPWHFPVEDRVICDTHGAVKNINIVRVDYILLFYLGKIVMDANRYKLVLVLVEQVGYYSCSFGHYIDQS